MSDSSADPTIEMFDVRAVRTRLQDLLARHTHWVMRRRRRDTIYCLPAEAIDVLASARPPLLDPAQVAAEREFTALCQQFFAIGTQGGRFIVGTPLNGRPGMPDPALLEWMKNWGWTDRHIRSLRRLLEKADTAAMRVKGYTGWLLTDPQFVRELDCLKELWSALPGGFRPAFPLQRPGRPVQHRRGRRFRPDVSGVPAQEFGDALVRLLDKWGLTHLATWDLPCPQGPLLPNPLPPDSPAYPRHGLHLFVPVFYPLRGDLEFVTEILHVQQRMASDLGIDESAAGLPRYEAHAQMLDVLHLERVIRSRFRGQPPPRGLSVWINEAVEACFDIGESRVIKYRKAVARCRRGGRQNVPILRVTPTARRTGSA